MEGPKLESETRKSPPRTRFDGWVQLNIAGESRRAFANDLSNGGICVELSEPLPSASTVIPLEFPLQGIKPPVVVNAVVAWVDHELSRLGLRFINVDPALGLLLESVVKNRL